jgi:CO/xanthine dehydrogenase Mo-binding subunit
MSRTASAGAPRIGEACPRGDAFSKVTGQEKFASDYFPENLLWLGVKRAAHPHARILGIDTSQVLRMEGVRAALTYRDIRGANRVGVPDFDQPVLCDDKVRHYGDPVAIVLVEDRRMLREALDRIQVAYEVLPSVTGPEQALAPDAPLVHAGRAERNLLLGGEVVTGRGIAGFDECEYTVASRFQLPCQEHAYLETECGVAWETGGFLTIVASTQTPFRDRLEVARALGLAPEAVRVIAPYLGGGFGGKDGITVQGLLGAAALSASGRPVKIVNSREESFLSSTKRHAATVDCRIGCDGHGQLRALECRILLDTGAYSCLGGAVLALAMEHAGGIYRFPHALVNGRCVYTNNPPAGAFRGFGVPQVTAALEQLVDELAGRAGLDPLEFRLRNALGPQERHACGGSVGASAAAAGCLAAIGEHSLWRQRKTWIESAPPGKRRGVGVAAAMHGMGYGPVVPDTAGAKIELLSGGSFQIYAGVADMGQGNVPTFAQIAAARLHQPIENIRVVLPDTGRTLPAGSSSASRTTFTFGNALMRACEQLEAEVLSAAAARLGDGGLILEPLRVRNRDTGAEISLAELAGIMEDSRRLSTAGYTAPVAPELAAAIPALRAWGLPHRTFSFAAHLAVVEIDELTGEVEVCRYVAATDAGAVLNPLAYEQQVQGGVAQGLGYALFEEFLVEDGAAKTPNLTTYILPTSLDVVEVESIPVATSPSEGPFGMKGLGEIVIDPVYPAVANAIAAAVPGRIYRGPMTAERVLRALAGEVRP